MKLSLELINAILGYLGTKPYAEVAQLIARIQQEAAAAAEAAAAPPATDTE